MQIEQVSIFMENKSRRLAQVTAVLSEANIAVKTMILADLSDFGVLRMIVDDPQKAKDHLKHQGFVVNSASVFAVDFDLDSKGVQEVIESLNQAETYRGKNALVRQFYCGGQSRHPQRN